MGWWLGLVAVAAFGCASRPSHLPDGSGPELVIESVEPETVLPGTWIRITGRGFVDENAGSLTVLLERGGGASWMISPEVIDDEQVEFRVDQVLFSALGGPGVFQGTLKVRADYPGGASQVAETSAVWSLEQSLEPALEHLSAAVGQVVVYLGTEVEALGSGFLLRGEGVTELRLSGTFAPADTQDEFPVEGNLIVLDAASRERLVGPIPASGFGIQPGVFSGDIIPVNLHEGGQEVAGGGLVGVTIELGPTLLNRMEPSEASRGQWIDIYGRGFVSGSATVVIRIEGTFTDGQGQVTQLQGNDALQIV